MKKLIYFTLGNNLEYLKLLDLCIRSLYEKGYDGDLLFITNFENEILQSIHFESTPFFLKIGESNLLDSSANKLKIHLFPHIYQYDKIIFSDLDVLWISSPEKIFDLLDENLFYMSNEGELMSHEFWGGKIFKDDEKSEIFKNEIFGVNAGVFAFNNSMIYHLKKMDEFLNSNLELVNICLEQPFINVYLYRNKIYNTKLNNLVSHNGYNLDYFDGVVLHFAGGPGNFTIKYDKMLNYYNKNLEKENANY